MTTLSDYHPEKGSNMVLLGGYLSCYSDTHLVASRRSASSFRRDRARLGSSSRWKCDSCVYKAASLIAAAMLPADAMFGDAVPGAASPWMHRFQRWCSYLCHQRVLQTPGCQQG